MSDRNTRTHLWLSICALLLAGCKTVYAPDGWLPDAGDLPHEAFGGWIYLQTFQGNESIGEFIAVNDSNVYVLGYKLDTAAVHTIQFLSVPRSSITLVRLGIHSTSPIGIAIWALLGTASTITHGIKLGITAPLWLLTGIPAIISEANGGIEEEESPDGQWWSKWSAFARFPQGLPPMLNPSILQPKP